MEVGEFHQQGSLGISNRDEVIAMLQAANTANETIDVGLQASLDGRIWLCVNGMAFLRFKPGMPQMFVEA
jgi:hypothetical protein